MAHLTALRRAALGAAFLLPIFAISSSVTAEESVVEKLFVAAGKTCLSTASDATLACKLAASVSLCKEGDAEACEVAGRVNLSFPIHDVAKGEAARPFLMRACALAPERCVDFSRISMTYLGDPELAERFLSLGCLRSAAVCNTAAAMYSAGRAVPGDAATARRFLERACRANDASACASLKRR
jgi:TPR repeat protein